MADEESFDAFSMLDIKSGDLDRVVAETSLLPKTESYKIFGAYDVVTIISAESYEEREAKVNRLIKIEGLDKVATYTVVHKLFEREIKRENVFAFVFFHLKPAFADTFCNEFPNIPQILEAVTLRGDYDALAIVHVKNIGEMSDLLRILQRITGVEKTVTCIVHN